VIAGCGTYETTTQCTDSKDTGDDDHNNTNGNN